MPSPTTAPTGQAQTSKPKLITNPLRLLILTPSDQSNTTIPALLQSLTGVPVTPPPASSSTADNGTEIQTFAGYTTHAPLPISNKYYAADVPIWVDEIPTSPSPDSPSATPNTGEEDIETTPQWKTTFLSPEAREVRDAIGAIVLCVRNPSLSISKAVPREALELATAATTSTTTAGSSLTLQSAIEQDGMDAGDRQDVRTIKELVGVVSELKAKIEEERNCGEEDEQESDVVGGAEVPGILVLVDEHSSSSSASKKKEYSSDKEEEEGLEAEEPFSSPWWEELLYEQGVFGMEVIRWTPSSSSGANMDVPETRNIYGELEGLPRLKEVLSTHEWTAASSTDNDDGDDDDEDDIMSFLNGGTRRDESTGFRFEVNQLEREMMGLRFAINGGDDEDDNDGNDEEEDTELQVENLEALMMRMRAIKGLFRSKYTCKNGQADFVEVDMSSDLPESKRKAFAAKAVKDIMREF
ncbi:uncharacterized protein BHQ10_006614 [Talaromyces amestolkiae]|uniref:Uncharacterized protein n=1 Tax=Talaromyces amestolkiae TaxID=1196081 RepID=A0A364L473_TALAM|nr:uncharacterized protein BHQ10_006614 [Talaromyces amestolkiae]RAO70602.1 hypothetical protein BHQ10_006614 [Talaromyces amestolkiae]